MHRLYHHRMKWNTQKQSYQGDLSPQQTIWTRCDTWHRKRHWDKWLKWIWKEMSPTDQKCFEIAKEHLAPADDFTANTLMLERYILQKPEYVTALLQYLKDSKLFRANITPTKMLLDREPIRKFIMNGRPRNKYYKTIWMDVRGVIACELPTNTYWNEYKLKVYRKWYIAKHGENVFHGKVVKQSQELQSRYFKQIKELWATPSDVLNTPFTMLTINDLCSKKHVIKMAGEFFISAEYCVMYWRLPMTASVSHDPELFRVGNVKNGTISSLKTSPPHVLIDYTFFESRKESIWKDLKEQHQQIVEFFFCFVYFLSLHQTSFLF